MKVHPCSQRVSARRLATVGLSLGALVFPACGHTPSEPSAPEGAIAAVEGPSLATFVDDAAAPFGTFNGIEFVRHTGFFEGATSLGEFRMPYEIIAPHDPSLGNGTVLVEPPHFGFGPVAREFVLGRELLFGNGFSYAAVGWGDDGLNVLDPTAQGLLLAGEPVANPGAPNPAPTLDEEILIQFTRALTTEPFAVEILGPLERRYAYGISQTASALMELQRNVAATQGPSLFDLTLLHAALWRPPWAPPGAWQFLNDDFEPIEGVGRVLFVEAEGDQLVSDAEQFRRAAGVPDYRVYEVAGAAHLPTPSNPLDHFTVMRAIFVAGDRWVRSGVEPPPTTLLESAPAGQIDPVYGVETGIARDGDLNALGGVRLPDLAVGRARFVASDPATLPPGFPPVFAVLTGSMVDLACEPLPGSDTDEPRFRNHGDYVNAFVRQVDELRRQGFLLEADAEAMKERAAESAVGKPGTCEA
jgi:hypothetical protein